jgi:predicted RND superfamily exporter protein
MIGGVIGDTLALLDRESPTMTPAELPAAIGNAYVRQSGPDEIYAVRIFPKGSISDPIFMSEFRTLLTALDPEVTGLPMTFLAWGELFRQGLEQSAFVALFLIVFLVWLDFRNVRYTALAFLPLVLGTVWMVGAMNWLSIDYNFANVIALPLILGIGIDSGVHVLHRYREGTTPDRLPLTTGKAVLMSSLTTVLAFGTLAAASHRGLQTLGITLVIGVVGCLLSSSLVLPALLQWLKIINPAKKSP